MNGDDDDDDESSATRMVEIAASAKCRANVPTRLTLSPVPSELDEISSAERAPSE